jgi:DNA-binding GntR family transcriptional regulator
MSNISKALIEATVGDFVAALPRTRRAQVAQSLRNSILSGQLAPGTQLVESKLADRFGVSRGSIREAFRELVDGGLLVYRPYAGTFVVSLDNRAMSELFAVRGALERYCFSVLWWRRDDKFRHEFTARHLALVKTVKAQKRLAVIEAEMRLHSYPFEFAGNQILLAIWHQLSQKIQLSFVMSQAIVRDSDFIAMSQRYVEIAIGEDLDRMLSEIDRHLELGLAAVKRLMMKDSSPRIGKKSR